MIWASLVFVFSQAGATAQSTRAGDPALHPSAQTTRAGDPALESAVERFYATQEAEDIDGYLALWSATAQRPQRLQLKYIFDSGDDKFSEITILRVQAIGAQVRVRVSVVRDRTEHNPRPGAPPLSRHWKMLVSLTYVREAGDRKLVREGPAVDDLAVDLLAAKTPDEREVLVAADPDLVNEALPTALTRLASVAAQKMNYREAQSGYERALEIARRIGSRAAEGNALQNLANALYFQREYQRALETYSARLAIERERGNDAGMAAAFGGIGSVRYAVAEYGAALTAFRSALAIQEVLDDDAGLGTTLISTGNVLYLQGDFDAAIADYRRSRDLNRHVANTAGEAVALEGLGRVYMAQGNLASALDAFTEVLAEKVARADRNGQGTALMNVGEVHFRLGNLDFARARFDEARGHFDATSDAANGGRAWQSIALTDLVAGRFQIAEQGYENSIASCNTAQDRECIAVAVVGLAFAQSAQDKFTDAIATYKKAIDRFAALNRREQVARAEVGLSQALGGNGQHEEALAAAGRARTSAVALGNDDVLWRALVAEARALRRMGEHDKARGAAQAAIYAVQSLTDAAQVVPGSPVPRDTSEAFALLAVIQADKGEASAAFDTSERLRVHALRSVLATNEREISRGMTPEEREEERAAFVELVSLHAQLTREKGLPHPDAARVATIEQNIAAAAEKRAAQQHRLFSRLPDLRAWRGLIAPVTAADLPSVLNDGTVLIDFIVDDDDLVVLGAWSGADGPEFALGRASVTRRKLADRVGKMVQPAVLENSVEWRRVSAGFFELIPPAILDRLARASRALILPHGILCRVPFEALPIGNRYLGDLTSVVFAPSISTLLRPPSTAATPDPSVLAIGSPAIASSTEARVKQTAPGWTLRSSESAEREARLAAGDDDHPTAPVNLLLGKAATEAAARNLLPRAGVVHVAAPFRVNGASPLFSAIMLADDRSAPTPPTRSDDGMLDPSEIINLDLHARVAILSDGSALSMRDAADDVGIVQWAWRAAGVPSLVLSRWNTTDDAVDAFIKDLHQRLREGQAPDEALAAARRSVRRTERWPAPIYWAGWFITGR
jgi:tetratricopeptide (TPR) repeat protein